MLDSRLSSWSTDYRRRLAYDWHVPLTLSLQSTDDVTHRCELSDELQLTDPLLRWRQTSRVVDVDDDVSLWQLHLPRSSITRTANYRKLPTSPIKTFRRFLGEKSAWTVISASQQIWECWHQTNSWNPICRVPWNLKTNEVYEDYAMAICGVLSLLSERACVNKNEFKRLQNKWRVSYVPISERQHICERDICYRPSVRLSVRLSHAWISQKRLTLGSCNFHRTVAPSL